MNRHKKLDMVLSYMSKNIDSNPRRPDAIIRSSKLNIEDNESFRMFRMMKEDGYVYEHEGNGVYGISYKGLLFLENGGYEYEHSKYKLQKNTTKVSNTVDIMVKPIGVLTAVLVCIWYVIKLLGFFGIICS